MGVGLTCSGVCTDWKARYRNNGFRFFLCSLIMSTARLAYVFCKKENPQKTVIYFVAILRHEGTEYYIVFRTWEFQRLKLK